MNNCRLIQYHFHGAGLLVRCWSLHLWQILRKIRACNGDGSQKGDVCIETHSWLSEDALYLNSKMCGCLSVDDRKTTTNGFFCSSWIVWTSVFPWPKLTDPLPLILWCHGWIFFAISTCKSIKVFVFWVLYSPSFKARENIVNFPCYQFWLMFLSKKEINKQIEVLIWSNCCYKSFGCNAARDWEWM